MRFLILEKVIEFLSLILLCFKILSLCPKNSTWAWAKSIKLVCVYNGEWRKVNSFLNTLILDFFWRISPHNYVNWQCWYVLKDFQVLLRENCPNTEFFLVRNFLHSGWIGRDTEYLSVFRRNAGKYRPEKTRYLDTFHAVLVATRKNHLIPFQIISLLQVISVI